MTTRQRVLFLCTGNSCRSQMAEGFARQTLAERFEPYSAGLVAHGLNEHAVQVMAEVGVDISHHNSNTVNDYADIQFDYVITVCGHADEHCPVFPATTAVVHRGFDDPPTLAQRARDREEALGHYRRVRDEIRAFIETLPGTLDATS